MQVDLTSAMRERDRPRVSVLRSTLAAIANAEAVDVSHLGPGHLGPGHLGPGRGPSEVPRRYLSETDIVGIVQRELNDLARAADEFAGLGQAGEAGSLRSQADILASYLAAARPVE